MCRCSEARKRRTTKSQSRLDNFVSTVTKTIIIECSRHTERILEGEKQTM